MGKKSPTARWRKSRKNFPNNPLTPASRRFSFGLRVKPRRTHRWLRLPCFTKPRMFSALFYLQYHSFRNRLVSRFRRLKQPKYLIGAIVGGLYFYWYFFRSLFRGFATGGQPVA